MNFIDLDALEREAGVWLIDQPNGQALPPDVAADYRRRFYVPSFFADLINRIEEEKEAGR